MAQLEELVAGVQVEGIVPDGPVTVVATQWFGSEAIELTFKDPAAKLDSKLLYRHDEPGLKVRVATRAWSFDADGELFRLVAEAHRIRLAYLFDPLLAVHTSLVQPLPHQITAVYGEMLTRQPLRFLLADDTGAGKTIMAGLLIKELIARGDVKRCLIVCPGSLVEQWQDELDRKFHLPFDILTNDKLEAARGNWFAETSLAICRLDKLARSDDAQARLAQTDWDLIVVDEAHKMSASFFGGEIKYTQRYRLGEKLAKLTRHFLLMTATPHNGKEEEFQLFMQLLDPERFEGKFRDGVHASDPSDLMRRMVKEQLLKFDGTPLFPERQANTIRYALSSLEQQLYDDVTAYVREEFNRADALANDGRKGTVGFALTILQRRLASSPRAIFESLRRRRERLEKRLGEVQSLRTTQDVQRALETKVTDQDLDELEDAPGAEFEETEETIVDQATAARTIEELQAELASLRQLELTAGKVLRSGQDRKWDELRQLLQENPLMLDADLNRRKLVVFTEHRDTLEYLVDRIGRVLGRADAVVAIHGGLGREERKKAEAQFKQEKDVQVLVATDAAGEGINLQRAHLMVNYDLPWNPNRLEQRFGRIHRIGQPEVCHLWNLLAENTRESNVFDTLLRKLDVEQKALKGGVFDVLGRIFQGTSLRELLIEAIRYGERPDVKERLKQVVDQAMDRDHLRALLEDRALARDTLDQSKVRQIREEMERAEARKLQPHFIQSFFIEAFTRLGGSIREREDRRFEITHVPSVVRSRERLIGTGEPILQRYERVTFNKELVEVSGKPLAAFVCPGHPLLDAVLDLTLERYRSLLKQGAILVDEQDEGDQPRVLFCLEHAIQDGRSDATGKRRVVSRQLQFVEIDSQGKVSSAGYAPFLNYRPLAESERTAVPQLLAAEWLKGRLDDQAYLHAIRNIVPEHVREVKQRKDDLVLRTMKAVQERLTKEISFWDHRAEELRAQEEAGKQPKMNWQKARERADDLQARLTRRMNELAQEKLLSPQPPVVVSGALVVPQGLVTRLTGQPSPRPPLHAKETAEVERLAMVAVMDAERRLGFAPADVSAQKLGYDVESAAGAGRLRFIEVKGRVAGAKTVSVTKNEILTALNKPDDFILAIVEIDGAAKDPRYVRQPFQKEPDFGVTSVTYALDELLERSEAAG